jgi:hypothetical protein
MKAKLFLFSIAFFLFQSVFSQSFSFYYGFINNQYYFLQETIVCCLIIIFIHNLDTMQIISTKKTELDSIIFTNN